MSSLNPVYAAGRALSHSTIEGLAPLTPEEESERHRLELKVERAFYEAGAALRELSTRRLYRSTHKTFEEYCRERFDLTRSAAYYLMSAATVMDNLSQKCQQIVDIFPTKESQCRELAKLEPDEQPEAWIESVERTGGRKVPSAAIVRGVVAQIKQRNASPPPIPYREGDVVMIRATGNPDLRLLNGRWAIAIRINEYTVTVSLDSLDVSVKPQFLSEVDPKYWADIKAVHEQVTRLSQCELDPVDNAVLEVLARCTCFSERQMIVLQRLLQDYGII